MQQLLQLLVLSGAVIGSLAQCESQTERLENLTAWPKYDKNSRPNQGRPQAVNVSIQMYIAAIANVDQKGQQLAVEGYFRWEWMDPRLASGDDCGKITLQLPAPSVWQPDIYVDNTLDEWYGAGSLVLYPDGRAWRSARFNHKLRCPMEFHALPFDKQRCFVQMSSYSWDIDHINAGAFSNGAVVLPEGYTGTTEWKLGAVEWEVTTEWFGVGANRQGYKYVWIYITLERRPNAFMVFVFFTCFAFGIVSWVGLFISPSAAPARVAIAVIPVLIMLNLESSVTSQLPPLNYMTWLTSYLFTIKLFTLSVVVEYGVVSWLMTIEAHRVRKFEAMKQMAAAMKLDNHAVKHAGTDPAEEKVDKQGTIIVLEKSPEQVHEVYKLFDADLSGCINKHEIQLGFRKLGQYLSFDQVNRMFFRLGVEGESLQKADFHRLLMDLNDYLPGTPFTITYWERPPSIQVDIAFRYIYIVALFIVCVVWLAVMGM